MSYKLHRNCRLCNKEYHACSNCGLSDEEYEASYLSICFDCWQNSGAQLIYQNYQDQKENLNVLRDEEIKRLIESKKNEPNKS